MEVKKFEGYKSGDYDYEYGGYALVLARPKKGWHSILPLLVNYFEDDDFIPCMITGNSTGQSIYVIGRNYSYDLNEFDIIKDSDKGFKEMIELYSSAKKYNL